MFFLVATLPTLFATSTKAYITDHLPKLYYLQPKSLIFIFKEAWLSGSATGFTIINKWYNLYVKEKLSYPKKLKP